MHSWKTALHFKKYHWRNLKSLTNTDIQYLRKYKFLRIPWISSLLNNNLKILQIPGPHLHSWDLHSKYFNCNLNYEISRTFRFSHKKHKNIFFRNACELLKSEFSEKQYIYIKLNLVIISNLYLFKPQSHSRKHKNRNLRK